VFSDDNSHEEALAMPITKKAKYPDKPIGKDTELLQVFVKKCAARQNTTSSKLERELLAAETALAHIKVEIQEVQSEIHQRRQQLQIGLERMLQQYGELTAHTKPLLLKPLLLQTSKLQEILEHSEERPERVDQSLRAPSLHETIEAGDFKLKIIFKSGTKRWKLNSNKRPKDLSRLG
jgi:hypothetical protein